MLFAVAKELPKKISSLEFVDLSMLPLALLGVVVFAWLFQRTAKHGPQVRHDLFALPETLAGTLILAFFVLIVMQKFYPTASFRDVTHEASHAESAVPMGIKEMLMQNMIFTAALPGAVLGILVLRGGRLADHFGFRKLGPLRTLGTGVGLGLLALALTTLVSLIARQFMPAEEQMLIQRFRSAENGGQGETLLYIAGSAVFVAPVLEEFLFRGIFYPVLTRGIGRVPSAVFCSLLFAFAHDTYSDVPGLAVLALLLTLAYEATGSLLVPMLMHLTFNGTSLAVLWWSTGHLS